MTAVDGGGVVLDFPRPSGRCSMPGCDRPARMALGTGRGVAGFDRSGRPRALGHLHAALHYDWRAVPTAQAARLYCKRHGIERLAVMVELYVSDDEEPALDPEADPADPNETMLRRLAKDTT